MKKIIKSILIPLLLLEAKLVLRKYKPKIVAVTGNVGKTSTKDEIYTALSRFLSVRKSQKSFNSEIGTPLAVLGFGNPARSPKRWLNVLIDGLMLWLTPNHYPEWLVLEIGTDRPGDIKEVTHWIKPDVVVVTRLSKVPVHVEFFSSPEELFKEKGYLVQALKPSGTLVLNADDENVMGYIGLTDAKVVLFGKSKDADIHLLSSEITYEDIMPTGMLFEIQSGEETASITLTGTLGEHHAYGIMAALAVSKALGEAFQKAAEALSKHEPAPGRMRIIDGKNGSVILDDSYNSSPIALEEALNTLKKMKAKRKIAVLGDMLELGKFSIDEHKKAGVEAYHSVDMLVTVGIRARYAAEAALEAGMKEDNIKTFNESRAAGQYVNEIIRTGDAVLVKGSQGVRVERVVEAIMAHPEDKEKLLVRQDWEWKNRR